MALGCANRTGEVPFLVIGSVVDTAGHPGLTCGWRSRPSPVDVPDIAVLTGEDGGFSITVPAEGAYGVAAISDEGRTETTVEVRRARRARSA